MLVLASVTSSCSKYSARDWTFSFRTYYLATEQADRLDAYIDQFVQFKRDNTCGVLWVNRINQIEVPRDIQVAHHLYNAVTYCQLFPAQIDSSSKKEWNPQTRRITFKFLNVSKFTIRMFFPQTLSSFYFISVSRLHFDSRELFRFLTFPILTRYTKFKRKESEVDEIKEWRQRRKWKQGSDWDDWFLDRANVFNKAAAKLNVEMKESMKQWVSSFWNLRNSCQL